MSGRVNTAEVVVMAVKFVNPAGMRNMRSGLDQRYVAIAGCRQRS